MLSWKNHNTLKALHLHISFLFELYQGNLTTSALMRQTYRDALGVNITEAHRHDIYRALLESFHNFETMTGNPHPLAHDLVEYSPKATEMEFFNVDRS